MAFHALPLTFDLPPFSFSNTGVGIVDLPLRTRLLGALVGVVLLCGLLTIVAGSFLINRMVIGEAQRRVDLALKTAHAMLERRLEEALKVTTVVAAERGAHGPLSATAQILDSQGRVIGSGFGDQAGGGLATGSPVIGKVLREGLPAAGLSLLPPQALSTDDEKLLARTEIRVLPTPHAKSGGAKVLSEVMVLEAAAPFFDEGRQLGGVVRVGTVLNRNFDFVDFVRENIFTAATYEGKNLGTVTIFQGDVRITTNVVGPDGERAVGTQVSAEVHDRVLREGKTWTGPAFVVDSWYISAYKPLRDIEGHILGMLYVGVLEKRYNDMRNQATELFLLVSALGLVGAVFLSFWLAARLTRPLVRLNAGAAEVARGNLSYQLPSPPRAERDEILRLTRAFNQMVAALKERDEQLGRSRDDLQRTANELEQWVQNYLGALEFITHELKNQIAAMKINLLAVRDGYVGEVSDEQKEALDDVRQAIHRAEEMILNYLNLSRIEKGELQVRARPVHVDVDVVRPVLNNLRGRLDAKGIQVEVDTQEEVFVQADPSLLQIVYENLLGNAAKYGRQGGRVRVSGRRLDGKAELHVWNDGPGVPVDQTDRLFEKFFRIQNPAEQERGTGLGLFITREIIRRHRGDIRAESVFGEWIDFVFTLPVPDALLEEKA
jgi:two-component system NtrC family sensor kinase